MTALEQSEVVWGTTRIAYAIRRSARRTTVSLAVEPGGMIVLTAPPGATVAKLDSIVRAKAQWLVQRKRERETLPPPRMREFVSGETFRYLGKQYRLRLMAGVGVRPIALRAGWLELPVPEALDEEARPEYVRAALADWYTRIARERFEGWVDAWAKRAGQTYVAVKIADQEKRWGSCSQGVLRFNWRLMQAPRALIDYVIAHELVHLKHEHHDAAFWAALGRLMPDYERRKDALRTLGGDLIW